MKCLRCGRELKRKGSFCDDCNLTAAIPLEDSAYLQKKVCLPQRRPAQKPKKTDGKKTREAQAKPRRLFCMGLCIACTALLFLSAYLTVKHFEARREISRLGSVEDECVMLTDKLRQAEARILELENLLAEEKAP